MPRRRGILVTPYRSRLPVICIGNFTAGGTGKTPLAAYLCERLKYPAVNLSRGRVDMAVRGVWVNANSDVSSDVGDEALLLHARSQRSLRVIAPAEHAMRTGPHSATVIVMDDGLQNAQLAKDLTLAVVDGGRGLGNGLVMPAGPLRAALEFQLELTDRGCYARRRGKLDNKTGCAIAARPSCARPSTRKSLRLAEGACRGVGGHRRPAALLFYGSSTRSRREGDRRIPRPSTSTAMTHSD